ncbi:MAG: endonuclease/exonuclease/phosphatase family protein [bacterium]|nr:endonuclease/exonuclease/phosphatase family protein [bacterium]
MQLKILSWNIWYHGNFAPIAAFLKASDADIIGLQELVLDDPERDTVGYLKKFGYDAVCAPVKKLEDGRTMCNAIFSKHKIIARETFILSEAKSRNAVRADIQAGETTLHVFSTHLLHTDQKPSAIQDEQVDNLIKVLPSDHTIVMGDFNATPDSSVIQKMRAVMEDTELRLVPTLNADLFDCPECDAKSIASTRLDYIFTSKDMKTSTFKVEHENGSDHFPVSILIEI